MPRGKMGSVAYLTPPDAERDREQAFQEWLDSAPTAYLECRNGRHIKRGLTDKSTELSIRAGMCYVEEPCPRCGTTLTSTYGVQDGELKPKTRSGYVYPEGYLLPKDVTGPGGSAMDKEHRKKVRLELMERGFRAHGTTLSREISLDAKRAAGKAARAAAKLNNPPF